MIITSQLIAKLSKANMHEKLLYVRTNALWYTPTPLSIGLTGSFAWSLQFVSYITGVGYFTGVEPTGEGALTIYGSSGIVTVNVWRSRKDIEQI